MIENRCSYIKSAAIIIFVAIFDNFYISFRFVLWAENNGCFVTLFAVVLQHLRQRLLYVLLPVLGFMKKSHFCFFSFQQSRYCKNSFHSFGQRVPKCTPNVIKGITKRDIIFLIENSIL